MTKVPENKKKTTKKKSKKKVGPSPIENQLMEAGDFMKYKLEEFDACASGTTLLAVAVVQ